MADAPCAYTYALGPRTGVCPLCGGEPRLITGQDEASVAYLNGWRHWCSRCQHATVPRFLAEEMLRQEMGPGQIGVVIVVRFPLDFGEEAGQALPGCSSRRWAQSPAVQAGAASR